MPKRAADRGDFGLPRTQSRRDQVIGIFDLVGFTDLQSNKELVTTVTTMEKQLALALEPEYWWDERTRGGKESGQNDILLRSTGDGYVLAFSHGLLNACRILGRMWSRTLSFTCLIISRKTNSGKKPTPARWQHLRQLQRGCGHGALRGVEVTARNP